MAQTVEDIMRERGVGKRQAYSILRQQAEEQAMKTPIPHNQRERVLSVLYRTNVSDSRKLNRALHDEGVEIDGHDTTKVLWSLQKTNHVRFREHQNPRYLYAIRLTDQGKADAHRLVTETPVEKPAEKSEPLVTMVVEEPEPVEATAEEEEEEEEIIPEEPARIPEPVFSLKHYPNLRALRDRAIKARKLAEAARLLEEAGEDDIALNLIARTEFTPLEEEVLDLVSTLDVTWE